MLLALWQSGESGARDRLIARLHPELAQIAAARLRGERNSSLSTGDLINDAVLRLIQVDGGDLADRAHFIALASRMMRHILVDHARVESLRQAPPCQGRALHRTSTASSALI